MRDLTPAEQLVDEVLAKQRAKGRAKYGAGLDAHDGHDWPMEALQELTDATQYMAAENVRLRDNNARLRAANERLHVAVSRLIPHVYTGVAEASDRIRREAVALLRGEAPDA